MKKLFLLILFLILLSPSVLSQCTLNGEVVPCPEVPLWAFGIIGWFGVVFFLFFLVMLAGFAFWIWMIVDCAQHEKKDQLAWILVIVFAQLLGAIIYYAVVKRKRKK